MNTKENKDNIKVKMPQIIDKVPLIPTISSLHQEKYIKETNKIDIYNIVLNKIVEKILYTNRHTDKTYVIFEVPKILIGYPQYDMKSCILFIINRLSLNDYFVDYLDPFYIYIDWGSKESRKEIYKRKIKTEIPLHLPKFVVKNADNLKAQTKALLTQFPDTSKVEFVYEDKYKEKLQNKGKKNINTKGKKNINTKGKKKR
jgi:hypothetical protein